MPKRIIDGEGLWSSDKLASVTPAWVRAEYANLIPLAMSNGVFEISSKRVWAKVYSYNRPEITARHVKIILDALERARLLFRWRDTATGKVWGFWTGIDRPGRLPPASRQGYHEAVGPEPPKAELSRFLGNCQSLDPSGEATESPGQPMRSGVQPAADQRPTNGCLGLGVGVGVGVGEGARLREEHESEASTSDKPSTEAPSKDPPQKQDPPKTAKGKTKSERQADKDWQALRTQFNAESGALIWDTPKNYATYVDLKSRFGLDRLMRITRGWVAQHGGRSNTSRDSYAGKNFMEEAGIMLKGAVARKKAEMAETSGSQGNAISERGRAIYRSCGLSDSQIDELEGK